VGRSNTRGNKKERVQKNLEGRKKGCNQQTKGNMGILKVMVGQFIS